MASDGATNCIDIILPPLGVFLKFGCDVEFWICLVLTFFGYLPGINYLCCLCHQASPSDHHSTL